MANRRLMVACMLFSILGIVGIGLYFDRAARHTDRVLVDRLESLFNFGLRLEDHEMQFGRIPFDDNVDVVPGHTLSWRVRILSDLAMRASGLDQGVFDESRLQQWGARSFTTSEEDGDAEFLVVRGAGTVSSSNAKRLSDLPPSLIVIVRVPSSGIRWYEPTDISLDELGSDSGHRSLRAIRKEEPLVVLFADGTVWALNSECPADIIMSLMIVESAAKLDRIQTLGQYRIAYAPLWSDQ